ncbi:MAG: hypothetical protein U5Q03_12255 [Bacteroidota bacterium]|nr:hypothetical protein [Bacteroidota bacterium]
MRRSFSIGLALLMVLSTIGVTINIHYSHGELFSISLFDVSDPCCDMDCTCCYEESKTYQVKDEFITSSFDLAKFVFSNAITIVYKNLIEYLFDVLKQKAYLEKDKSPPGKNTFQEYNQVFLL